MLSTRQAAGSSRVIATPARRPAYSISISSVYLVGFVLPSRSRLI
ncbi:hypothetical protein PT7_2071 [Pusillimonas sp. T7-7]|nr:hypothetical protein PT7_2071 [Pusillimonas sp. T7-7]